MNSLGRDLASEIHAAYAAASTSVAAGGSGDNTEVTGVTIDLLALPTRYESVAFVLAATATLGATETLTVTAKIETSDASDMSGADTIVASATVMTLTGAAGGSTERGGAKVGVSLEYAKRYLRVKFTPDLSRANTDTAVIQSAALFGGAAKRA